MKKHAVICLCALFGFVCVFARENRAAAQAKKPPAVEAPMPQIDKEKIRAHVKYLSSDELEGRGTGQRGGDMAADYIGRQFASYGLKPAGDKGTFFQEVPMVGVKTLAGTTFEFVEPSSDDPDFFKGKALTYYGRWTYKFEETARRGAVAALIIHRTDLASYGWDVVRNSWGTERSYLKRDETPKLQAASWIQLDVAKRIMGLVGLDLDKLFQRAQMKDFRPLQLPIRLKAHVASKLRPFVSRNVMAMRPGADPVLGKEAVLY